MSRATLFIARGRFDERLGIPLPQHVLPEELILRGPDRTPKSRRLEHIMISVTAPREATVRHVTADRCERRAEIGEHEADVRALLMDLQHLRAETRGRLARAVLEASELRAVAASLRDQAGRILEQAAVHRDQASQEREGVRDRRNASRPRDRLVPGADRDDAEGQRDHPGAERRPAGAS